MPREIGQRLGRQAVIALAMVTLAATCSSDASDMSPGGGTGGSGGNPPSVTAGTGGGGAGGQDAPAGTGGAMGPADALRPDAPVRAPDGSGRDTPAGTDASRDGGSASDGGVSQNPPGNGVLGAACAGPSGDRGGCQTGLLCCQPCCEGRPQVCTQPVQNAAGIGIGQCPLPDLAINVTALEANLGTGPMTFAANSCEARETCVAAPGTRNTLHFEVRTPNIGTADVILGIPGTKPGFEYATCHEHYHYNNYALYQLLDQNGNEVLTGLKRAFCLMDTDPNPEYPLPRASGARYTCARQGIQRGWSDSYYNGLECQYIDVTGVVPGRYTLRVTVNPYKAIPELSYDNNVGEVAVNIGPMIATPTEPCVGLVNGTKRECGWQRSMTRTCTPGSRMRVGCGAECGIGTRTGDPMMRVCPGNGVCPSPGLGTNDDCGGLDTRGARVDFTCPASGQFTVLTGPVASGRAATCTVQAQAL